MLNDLCARCDEWIKGRCGGIANWKDPGGCWVEMQPTGDTWDDETGQMAGEEPATEKNECQ